MSYKLLFVSALILLRAATNTFCQHAIQGPLNVGDRMPDYTLVNLINYKSTTARLSDFKGKMVILDFWSTTCGSCIESWPKVLELQKQFSDKIQIVLVNAYQDERIVRESFDKRKRVANVRVDLPTVCGDTVLSNMFPRLGVPHVIWIDEAGRVVAKTDGQLLNAKNVSALIANPNLQLPSAMAYQPGGDIWANERLFTADNGGEDAPILEYSVLSGFISSANRWYIAMVGNDTTRRYHTITAVNQTIRDLYGYAFSNRFSPYNTLEPLTYSRIFMNGFDSTDYMWAGEDGITIKENLFSYQLTTEVGTLKELQEKMAADLDRHFGFHTKWEKRNLKCRVLKIGDTAKYSTPTERKFPQSISQSKFSLNGAYNMNEVLWYLENLYRNSTVPIIIDTRFKGALFGIDLEVNSPDPDRLDAALRHYGMSFKEEIRQVDVLVISKQPH